MSISALVTTGRKFHTETVELAKRTAEKLALPYVERKNFGLDELKERYQVQFVLIAKKNALSLATPQGELFFHPNMAHLRVKNLRLKQQQDHMVEALGLKAGMSVLDCTLGFASDSIVASYVVGETGKVVGVESQPLIEAVVSYGLQHYQDDSSPYVLEAMRRVQTVCTDALSYLKGQDDDAFDVVYFDPMFRHPFLESKSLDPLRTVANRAALTPETIIETRRVAKYRVVMKETSRSLEFARLGFQEVIGGTYSKVHYGIIAADER